MRAFKFYKQSIFKQGHVSVSAWRYAGFLLGGRLDYFSRL